MWRRDCLGMIRIEGQVAIYGSFWRHILFIFLLFEDYWCIWMSKMIPDLVKKIHKAHVQCIFSWSWLMGWDVQKFQIQPKNLSFQVESSFHYIKWSPIPYPTNVRLVVSYIPLTCRVFEVCHFSLFSLFLGLSLRGEDCLFQKCGMEWTHSDTM